MKKVKTGTMTQMKHDMSSILSIVGSDMAEFFVGTPVAASDVVHGIPEADMEQIFLNWIVPLLEDNGGDPEDIPECAEARVHPDGWVIIWKDLPIQATGGVTPRFIVMLPPGHWELVN